MTPSLHEQIAVELHSRRWVHVALPEAAEAELLIRKLGDVVTNPRTRADHCDLVPYEIATAPRASMSSLIGTAEQPMHTDAAFSPSPPRYVALQCLERGEHDCPTNVWTLDEVKLVRDHPPVLTEPTWVFENGVDVPFYSSIVERKDGRPRIRYDPHCMRPASFSRHTLARAEHSLQGYTQQLVFNWQNDELLIIDNWRCLHARGSGAEMAPSRRLRRWCIGADYGMGKRIPLRKS